MIRKRNLILLALVWTLNAGCGSDDDSPEPGSGQPLATRFVLGTTLLGDTPLTYVQVLSSIPEGGTVDLDTAREYSGFATVATHGDNLYVSDGDAPRVRRYTITSDDALENETTVAFDQYGFQSVPLYTATFVDDERAFVQREQTRRVAWNPTAMTIAGEVETTAPATERGGLLVRAAYDRAVVVRDDDVLQPFYWSDDNYYRFDAGSQIGRYDRESGALISLIDAPCPGLDVASVAANGDVIFSNWVFAAAAPALEDGAPETCTLRLRAGADAFADDARIDTAALVGSEATAAFRLLADGSALIAVLDRAALPDRALTAFDITGGAYWRLWRINTAGTSAAPIEGLPLMAPGYYFVEVDGTTLVFVPSADYATTTAYAIAADGTAAPRFEVRGWAYQVLPLR